MKVGVGVRLKASIAGQLLDWSDTVADLAPLGRPAPGLVRHSGRPRASWQASSCTGQDTVADLAPLGRPAPALVRTITVYLIFI